LTEDLAAGEDAEFIISRVQEFQISEIEDEFVNGAGIIDRDIVGDLAAGGHGIPLEIDKFQAEAVGPMGLGQLHIDREQVVNAGKACRAYILEDANEAFFIGAFIGDHLITDQHGVRFGNGTHLRTGSFLFLIILGGFVHESLNSFTYDSTRTRSAFCFLERLRLPLRAHTLKIKRI